MGCAADDASGFAPQGGVGGQPIAGQMAFAGQGGSGGTVMNGAAGATGGIGGTGMEPMFDPNAIPDAGTITPDASTDHDPTMMPGELAMDECGLDTKYAGDEYCILPPPPDKGFQLHIGPSNYDNPELKYLLAPGQEVTSDFSAVSSNDKPIHFYYRQFRMRNGAHHNIITASDGGGLGLGHRIGTSNRLAEDSPQGGIIAPENAGVGIGLGAHTNINVNLHSINTSEETQLREVWINFWYVDEDKVTEPVNEVFATGSVLFAIGPHEDTMLGPFSCNVTGNGRMLWMYGHRHANNVRFSAWRQRGLQRDVIYEATHWEEPLVLEYSSTVMNNTMPDLANGIEGGWSGILDLQAGDQIGWECHVINQTDGTLRFTNNTYTGEMCIVDAELVGANCN